MRWKHTGQRRRKRRKRRIVLLSDATTFGSTRLSTGSKTRWRRRRGGGVVVFGERKRRNGRKAPRMKRNSSSSTEIEGHRRRLGLELSLLPEELCLPFWGHDSRPLFQWDHVLLHVRLNLYLRRNLGNWKKCLIHIISLLFLFFCPLPSCLDAFFFYFFFFFKGFLLGLDLGLYSSPTLFNYIAQLFNFNLVVGFALQFEMSIFNLMFDFNMVQDKYFLLFHVRIFFYK